MKLKNVKEFFKPTKGKIILTGVAVIAYLASVWYFYYWPDLQDLGELAVLALILMPLIYGFMVPSIPFYKLIDALLGGSHPKTLTEYLVSTIAMGLPIYIVYWYVLSCTIIWIYDKVKKK